MAKEVYRFTTPAGHSYDYHGNPAALRAAHPGAVITGRRVTNAVGESHYEPYVAEPEPERPAVKIARPIAGDAPIVTAKAKAAKGADAP